jgi:hypothetical protein
MKHQTSRYPYVIVRDPDGGRTIHHEDEFFDNLTRDPDKRGAWVSKQRPLQQKEDT